MFVFSLLFAAALPAQETGEGIIWYRSNSSGMAIELIPSRLGALRREYSLAVRSARPAELPRFLAAYFDASYRIELRVLYKEGVENRRQWIFRDSRGVTRFTASGSGGLFDDVKPVREKPSKENPDEESEEEEEEKESRKGFIEFRNSEGTITRELQFDDDLSEWDFRFFYRDSTLLRTETWYKEAPEPEVIEEEVHEETGDDEEIPAREIIPATPKPDPVFVRLYTDYYRYTRSGSIRAIDRTFHAGAAGMERIPFPRLGPGASSGDELVTYGSAYTSGFFMGSVNPEGATINYNLDNRGRILTEVWKNENSSLVGEITNTWSGDRLQTVLWKSKEEERLIEYEYDKDGNRIKESNFRNGVLERSITADGDTDIEEVYMNGRLILRAYWENGVRIKEERPR